ncbi:MAG: tRNA (N6-isopentenyl adenosine(37)-C2)-methylthiotransferase MiaB [Bacteroidota bacterium]|nr:tRNA (N6-isopentenyl adenosine(37)-C2)-methylthiotransferase MiaB [Bacteroidota bacterium]
MIKEKLIDETKQGEILSLKPKKENQSKKLFLESYGCAMNFSDSEIVASILQKEGYNTTKIIDQADLVLINTCSIREKAEQTVRARLKSFLKIKQKNPKLTIGILGCMAERLKTKFLEEEKIVDLVVGPDAYRDLPKLIKEIEDGRKAVNVILSTEETYADVVPLRLGINKVTAYISIMRGCDNMCSFCVVPFTRGRERSRDPISIVNEINKVHKDGYKEVTLLGQNVDSYLWNNGLSKKEINKLPSNKKNNSINFAKLLDMVANNCPSIRIRFSTSHPQDMGDDVLHTMAKHKNICKYIHLPVQSGSSRILKLMNRGYDRSWYLKRIDAIKKIIPDCGISMDIITGFCTETDFDHNETLSLMNYVKYDFGYMFKYSERPNTLAQRKYKDNVDEKIKSKRLTEIINLQQKHSLYNNEKQIGLIKEILVEGISKKSKDFLFGRTTQNTVVVFPKENIQIGDFINVKISECTSATLIGKKC